MSILHKQINNPFREEQQSQQKYTAYSTKALKNMYAYAYWRVRELKYLDGVLDYIARDEGDISELYDIAERKGRIERNHKLFSKAEQEIMFEMVKREKDNE